MTENRNTRRKNEFMNEAADLYGAVVAAQIVAAVLSVAAAAVVFWLTWTISHTQDLNADPTPLMIPTVGVVVVLLIVIVTMYRYSKKQGAFRRYCKKHGFAENEVIAFRKARKQG